MIIAHCHRIIRATPSTFRFGRPDNSLFVSRGTAPCAAVFVQTKRQDLAVWCASVGNYLIFFLIQRMQVAHHLVEAGGVQVGVDLGRLDAGMAEQFLQHAQVGSA